ncbi:hypothetical protein DFH09DRAFT_1086333 [Mycena vulgaris]|nr:hypothetical protein DFH09DRAFT_1086333 [Mycena vulgaris]
MRRHAAIFGYVRLCTYVYTETCGEVDLRPATVRLHAVDTVRLPVGYPSATTVINDDQPLRNLEIHLKSWEMPHFNLIRFEFPQPILDPQISSADGANSGNREEKRNKPSGGFETPPPTVQAAKGFPAYNATKMNEMDLSVPYTDPASFEVRNRGAVH